MKNAVKEAIKNTITAAQKHDKIETEEMFIFKGGNALPSGFKEMFKYGIRQAVWQKKS